MKKYLFIFLLAFGLLLALPSQAQTVPKLTLTKIDTPDPVSANADLTYTINFTIADAAVTGLVLTDEIPANTIFVSASDPGKYDTPTNKVTWNYGDLNPGNYVTVLKVKVSSPLANGTKINNKATIDCNETEPLTASAETTVSTAPILTMDKTVDKTKAVAGNTINYTVKVSNSGSDTANNVKLADTLPAGFTFENGTYIMAYSFGNIEAGKTVANTYAVKIDASMVAGTYSNTATITADNHANLTDSVSINITQPKVLGEETVKQQPKEKEAKPLATEEEVKVLGEQEELVATGSGLLGLLGGFILVGTGFFLRKRIK